VSVLGITIKSVTENNICRDWHKRRIKANSKNNQEEKPEEIINACLPARQHPYLG
jgi:hypothetical protein